MHQPDRSKAWRLLAYSSEPGRHLGSIGVGTVTIDHLHTRMEGHIVAEDLQNRLSFHDAASKRVLSLKAHDEDSVAWIAGALRQMMQNPAVLHHSRRGNDHHWAVRAREGLRFLHI